LIQDVHGRNDRNIPFRRSGSPIHHTHQAKWRRRWHRDRLIEDAAKAAGKDMRPVYAGRDAAASPATGLAKRHQEQQEALIADALDLSSKQSGK
jgi:hypothetical protein